ncbi:MAG TPA: hypothetical protein H9784_10355 [Candidatus Desulfovibrio intestinavium]|uniref:Uncharacterized protein n=1 Tax=Candidatus Desulfovibrio intestinavium TaxID=2838534 RepID=A0A9D2HNG6_9BACT|nr:hypothetical protein [Candidatus Desulfovibrio intestinavium]
MATKRKTTEEKDELQAATPAAEQTSEQAAPGQEESHAEDAREQMPEAVETPEAPAAPETDAEVPQRESLSALAARHRVPSWQQAALCRYMGWADGKMLTDAEYGKALKQLAARHMGGGRR